MGTLTARGDTFHLAHLATPGIQRDRWAVSSFDPPAADTGYFLRAARAIESALTLFHPPEQRPYVAAAILAEDGPWWWVYVYPAAVRPGVWPHGGDARFRVSADGRIVTDARKLHDTITEFGLPGTGVRSVPGSASGYDAPHGLPEDTDVFHVLQRRPSLPELVATARHAYRIDVDGSIRYLGRTGDVAVRQ